ncbi:adenylate/guanylate cyclase domain-containing protein [Corynebacterium sp. 11A]|uniref:adenylate/guanylate cyclase domain-containing protein n=1 Tax=Corynebacterium sp. 11A TaxID=2080510 RepID=UPI00124C5B7E|nr:adenylate/guanylate cyclase domain-containing protein [Corynebacterium sp. 11A]
MNRLARALTWLWGTAWPLYGATVLGSNLLGAVAIMAFIHYLIPLPEGTSFGQSRFDVASIGIFYVFFAMIVGAIATYYLFKPVLMWQRHPDEHDRNMVRNLVMRIPVYQAIIAGVVWLIGIAILTIVASSVSGRFAAVIFFATFLGGSAVVLLTYFEAQRLVRPVATQALARRFEDSTLEPPVSHRMRLTWLATTAMPIVGIILLLTGQSVGYFTTEPADILPAILALCVVALITGLLVTTLLIMSVVDPIMELQDAINRVRRGEKDVAVDIYDGSEVGVLQAGFNEMMRGLRERQRVRDIFGRYVGAEVASRALEERPTLGGEDRKVAVLFVDVIGSTTFAVHHTPEQVVTVLNEFFEHVVESVHEHRGIINKFQGDAALAVFGAPVSLSDSTGAALATARDLQRRLKDSQLECGIGVATGHVVAGHIGGHDRFEYTVIGDAVNQAARLTELAKDTPGKTLTSASTLRDANEAEQARWTVLKSVELRGRQEMTQLARPIRPTLAERS